MPITVRSLHIYPVKGGRAVDVESISFTEDGLIVGDRAAMIVDADTGEFISQRHEPTLARLIVRTRADGLDLSWPGRPPLVVSKDGERTPRQVTVWDDRFLADDAGDAPAEWLSDAIGRSVRLLRLRDKRDRTLDPFWAGTDGVPTSFADLAPLLVVNAGSLDALNDRRSEIGLAPITIDRFRPNVVLSGLSAFAEDNVAELRSDDGGVSLLFIKPCARCAVIENDPATGEPTGDDILRSLAPTRTLTNRRGTRGIMFGQNAIARVAGQRWLRVGQTLAATAAGPEIA